MKKADIPAGQAIALTAIAAGTDVIRIYTVPAQTTQGGIGFALRYRFGMFAVLWPALIVLAFKAL